MAPDGSNMLPNTPGPKLRQFKDGNFKNIEFLEGMGSGNHSHVWRTHIDGEEYALKMFRNIGALEENYYTERKLNRLNVDKQLLDDQLSPFNCEARAYGRLQETGNEDLAWKCYGWIVLDEETYSQKVWGVLGLPRVQWFFYGFTSDEQVAEREVFPIYALVKEFIPEESRNAPPIDPNKAHDMAVAMNTLHRIGITHRDIQIQNYVDCRFMDFSTSWTVPNVRLDRQLRLDPKNTIDENDTVDYFMFDRMWSMWNYTHPDEQCDYRTTIEQTTRWNGTHSGSLPPKFRDLEPLPDPQGINDGAAPEIPVVPHNHGAGGAELAAPPLPPLPYTPVPFTPVPSTQVPSTPVPSTPVLSRFAYQGPDPKLPRFTMLWSWSAHRSAPRDWGFDDKKLEDIRDCAAEIIRESRRSKDSCAAIDRLVPRAQSIIETIDGFNGGSVDDLNGGPSDDFIPDDLNDPLANGDDDIDYDRDDNERQKKRPRKR